MVRSSFLTVVAAVLAACASEVVYTRASLSPAPGAHRPKIEIAEEATVQLATGFTRALPRGSVWEVRGSVPQGLVYRRLDGIFTVEGAQVHEAYLVLADNRLVGFYLSVEQAFSPTQPVILKLR